MDIGQIALSWIPAVIALLGAGLAWLSFARNRRKEQLEYFERTAKDLAERYERLESRFKEMELRLARHELALRYLKRVQVIPELVMMVADDIANGVLTYREAIDQSEEHD